MPDRIDPALQKIMKDAWQTSCGRLIATLLATSWCVRLFDSHAAKEEVAKSGSDTPKMAEEGDESGISSLIKQIGEEFVKGNFKNSSLCGPFRLDEHSKTRQKYLETVQYTSDLAYC